MVLRTLPSERRLPLRWPEDELHCNLAWQRRAKGTVPTTASAVRIEEGQAWHLDQELHWFVRPGTKARAEVPRPRAHPADRRFPGLVGGPLMWASGGPDRAAAGLCFSGLSVGRSENFRRQLLSTLIRMGRAACHCIAKHKPG